MRLGSSVERLRDIPGFSIDRVAAAAGTDPDVLRLENLDTDLRPAPGVIEATKAEMDEDDGNSCLPFTGRDAMKDAIAASIERRGGPRYDGRREIIVTPGEGVALLDALMAVTDPGDEVIVTDPTYAGMINRVRLAGAIPTLVPLRVVDGWWRLDVDALRSVVTPRTRAIFIHRAAFPTGWVPTPDEWQAIADVANQYDLWLIYWSLYEGVLFDDREVILPASLPGMRDRTITVGDVYGEHRMIGWRIGWVVAPGELVNDVARIHIYSGLFPSGFAQAGAQVALEADPRHLAAANTEWQRRRDETLRQLGGLPVAAPAGGWSLLLDTRAMGIEPGDLSTRLLREKVAATPMTGWGGEIADRHLRFVFSNEPVERLALLGARVRAALAASGR